MSRFLLRPRTAFMFLLFAVSVLVVGLVMWFQAPQPVQAASNFQSEFLAQYPHARGTKLDSCQTCHTQGSELNSYGRDFAALGHSIQGAEWLDSDRDGFVNRTEILQGTQPGDANNRPANLAPDASPQAASPQAAPQAAAPAAGVYKLIGWNDLGMHCMGPNYANMSILPPYNTLWAQLILQGPTPQIVTSGITIEYSIENNTYSVGKTNFWTYAYKLFGVSLPPNVGLAGKGMAGTMDAAGDHFVAAGIPLTAFYDGVSPVPANWAPYQIARLVAKDSATGQVLAETRTVAPVSEEMNCNACHADGMQEGIATGNVETNILTLHDKEEGTALMSKRPVLCQSCHGDNALGVPGNPNLPNLSLAMHNKHKVESGAALPSADKENLGPSVVTSGTNNCYLCHPGVKTQCLRDVMYQKGMTCIGCHGTTADVANPARRPWIDLPRCESCHGAQYAENPNTLFRNSTGHGGLYCEACHGSPHAILPSTQPKDNIQNIALQGYAGTLSDCRVCHGTNPVGAGPHGLGPQPTPTATLVPSPTPVVTASPTPSCTTLPTKPKLLAPAIGAKLSTRRVSLDWADTKCATTYQVILKRGSWSGDTIVNKKGLTQSNLQTPELDAGKTYYWVVKACNTKGCVTSDMWNFIVKSTATAAAP